MPRGAQPGFCCLKWLFCPDASCLHLAQFAEALGRDVKGPISCQDVQRMRQLPSCRDRLRVSDLWGRGVSLLAVFRSAWVGEATLRGDSHLFHWEIASQNNRLLHLERNLMVRWEKRSLIPSTSPVVPPPLSATPCGYSLRSLKPTQVHQAFPKFTLIDCDPSERLCPGFPGDFWVYNVDTGSTSSQAQVELSFLKAEGEAPDISAG